MRCSHPSILLVLVAGALSAGAAPAAGNETQTLTTQARARLSAVLDEFDREAAKPLWPGFEPASIPLEILDGGRTWLVRHPHPPVEFLPVAGAPALRSFEGRHESMRANTAVKIDGVMTATASFEGSNGSPRSLAALLLHEAFHVFQARRHPKWEANEVELFVYPVEDAEALALRRIESRSLTLALQASDPGFRSAWASKAVAARRLRFARIPAGAAGYERDTELKEGLARYIQARAGGESRSPFSDAEFPPDKVRDRAYASGSAIGLLLDRLDPRWKEVLEQRDEPLEEILGRAVAGTAPAALAVEEEAEIRRRAAADVAAWVASRATLQERFLATPGWKVVVESPSPLFAQGFDPLNVERLSSEAVLHTRFLKLGNADGSIEVLDHECLTAAAGKHPLFGGVRRVTVVGLSQEPAAESPDGRVRFTVPGVTLAFRNATVSREGSTLTILLGPPASTTPR